MHLSDLRCVCKIPPYSLAVISSVKFKVKYLTTVFNTVPSMCFRFMFLSEKIKYNLLKNIFPEMKQLYAYSCVKHN